MPRERQEIFRESAIKNKEKIIVLAFEGNDTEDIYFRALQADELFNDSLVHLYLLTRNKDDTNSAPKHVFNKLKKEAKDEYNFDKNDELWMIIDKDRWKGISEIVKQCKEQGNMFVACSNPCFEIWLLFHIEDIPALSDEDKTNLLANKRISKSKSSKRFIEKYPEEKLNDGYNKSNPKPERFLPHTQTAIRQARLFDVDGEDIPPGIGSHVYKIVEKIIK
ncbi:MAG: RloB family protein [Tannerellaceae bacterium]|jgi:hypothetical protein|nr:RloB family protein [Tannerellaceae bacterium]